MNTGNIHPPFLTISLREGVSFDMVYVEGGEFMMGEDKTEYRRNQPVHSVYVSPFYMAKYPVTQKLWRVIMDENPSYYRGENHPVDTVSWEEVQSFIEKLNKKSERSFRLPTEAEWEFAARGGIYSQGFTYCGSDKLKQVGWYGKNGNLGTHDVGLLLANELGFFDMSGNVWEWCEDWYDEKFYEKCKTKGVVENPMNIVEGSNRVMRGGSFFNDVDYCRPMHRLRNPPDSLNGDIGFRLAFSLQSVG